MGSRGGGLSGHRFTDQGPNTWLGVQENPILLPMPRIARLPTGVGEFCLSKTLRIVCVRKQTLGKSPFRLSFLP